MKLILGQIQAKAIPEEWVNSKILKGKIIVKNQMVINTTSTVLFMIDLFMYLYSQKTNFDQSDENP